MPVTVTATAAREIESIIKQQNLDAEKIHLRVGVKGGGCSGFSYLLDLTEVQKDSDERWSYDYTLKDEDNERDVSINVVCDPKSYQYLNGTSSDFMDELRGRGFVFNIPNATSSCGCGSSFSA